MNRTQAYRLIAVVAMLWCWRLFRHPARSAPPGLAGHEDSRRSSSRSAPRTCFPETRESRRPPEGTMARGHMLEDNPFNTGMDGKLYVGKNPVKVTEAVLTEGHWRFNAYCSPCHDETGLGKGMVPKRWPAWQPQNLMEDRIVEMADGDIFNVITYGRRTMPPYGYQNHPEDRWAIIAYVRVLQRAAHGTINDVPAELQSSVEYKGSNPQ